MCELAAILSLFFLPQHRRHRRRVLGQHATRVLLRRLIFCAAERPPQPHLVAALAAVHGQVVDPTLEAIFREPAADDDRRSPVWPHTGERFHAVGAAAAVDDAAPVHEEPQRVSESPSHHVVPLVCADRLLELPVKATGARFSRDPTELVAADAKPKAVARVVKPCINSPQSDTDFISQL